MLESNPLPKMRLDWRYVLLIVPPIVVFFGGDFLVTRLGDPTIEFPSQSFNKGATYKEVAGRYTFLSAYLFYLGVVVAVAFMFFRELITVFERRTQVIGTLGAFVLMLPVLIRIVLGAELVDEI